MPAGMGSLSVESKTESTAKMENGSGPINAAAAFLDLNSQN
jgi:hypothetical protein